ncbi:DUF6011 domain-containing protein [Methylobacterium sp. D48H]
MNTPDTTFTSRAALVARIAANAQAWNQLHTDIENTIAAYGCGSVSEYRYQTLDGIRIRGLDLQADLRELDATAAAALRPVMVQQQAQLQQADASKPAGAATCEACGRPLTDPYSIKAGIGPVCRAAGHTRRQLHLDDFLAGADFESEVVGDVITLIDLDQGGPTVTNAVEAVIADLRYQKFDLSKPVIYRDSRGIWDEIVLQDGQFAGFRSIGTKNRCEALEVIARRRIQSTPVTVMSVTDFLSAGAAAFTEVARIETDQDGRVLSVTFPRA